MPPFPELRDITPPPRPGALESILESPESIAALVWVAVVMLGAVISLVWWLRTRQRKPKFPRLPPGPAPAAQRRLEELRALAPALPAGELAGAVHEALRTYLHRARGVLARYRTTDELAGTTESNGPPTLPFLQRFLPIFRRCDTMRYSASDDRTHSRQELIDEALSAVAADERASREQPVGPPAATAAVPPSPPPPPLPPLPPPGVSAYGEKPVDPGTEPGPPPLPAAQSGGAGIFTRGADPATPVSC